MASNVSTKQEKCYNPQDPTLRFVDRDDDLDCEYQLALMSCGHAVTPTSLTNWCLRLLEQVGLIEKLISSVERENGSDLNVLCKVCTAQKGQPYEFCWQCLREWKGARPRKDRCDNDGCCNQSLKTLETCPEITFESVEGVHGCPSVRACPTCGLLVEHTKRNCKFVVCPRCKVKFCFVCLKSFSKCVNTSDYFEPCSSRVAPRQTSVPVWQKKPAACFTLQSKANV
uniref:RING-type domain-containing protein n=1 Tax=Amphilophus citrinellus TaxID=61819 RepID=A0A3Q0RPC6_AMPCI